MYAPTLFIISLSLIATWMRIQLQVIPNVQPITCIAFLIGVRFGLRHGGSFAILTTLASNHVLGTGEWTLYQISGWFLVATCGSSLRNFISTGDGGLHAYRISLICAFLAFPFDWWVSLPAARFGISPYLEYISNGLIFDLYHAVGNLFFALFLTPIMHHLSQKIPTKNQKIRSVGIVSK